MIESAKEVKRIRKRRLKSVRQELVAKSKEAALTAIKIFNDPLIKFKSETFIVLMIIAWTYLLHAYFRSRNLEYRYFKQAEKRRIFDKTKYRSYKYWELEHCLNHVECPFDKDTANNLRFLIQLRHEISHQMTLSLDNYLSGRYQACALNYNSYLKKLFGERHSLDPYLTYTIQFSELSKEQITGFPPEADIPERLRTFIVEFDGQLSEEEYNSPKYSYRLLFSRKLANRLGQADSVAEFVDPNSELAKTIDKQYWVKKEVERPKYRASDVVAKVREKGFTKFRVCPEHANMWKSENAKNPARGYGVDIRGSWYWYESWVTKCIELCNAAGEKYR